MIAAAAMPIVASAALYTSPGGPIADSPGSPNPGPPLVIPFVVTQLGTVSHVDLTLTGLTHSWAGDLVATLSGPGAAPTADIMRKLGASSSGSLGDSTNLGGNYRFIDTGVDPVPQLVALGSTVSLPSGDYWATTLGTNTTSGNKVNLDSVFGGINATGTWTLTITDTAGGDTGSLTEATLNVVSAGGAVPEPATIGALGLSGLGFLVRRRRRN